MYSVPVTSGSLKSMSNRLKFTKKIMSFFLGFFHIKNILINTHTQTHTHEIKYTFLFYFKPFTYYSDDYDKNNNMLILYTQLRYEVVKQSE